MKNLFSIVIFLLLASPAFAEEGVFLTNQNGVQTTQFESGDEIYIEGICAPANQDIFKIYITSDKTWQAGDKLSDVSSGIETLTASADAKVTRTKIWKSPLNQGTYDVAIDTNNNFTLEDYEQSCVIGITGAGFRVGNPAPPPPPPPPPPAEITPPSPPPVSAPAPTPPPLPSKPSVVFLLDESVEVKSLSNVRKSAGGTLIGTQAQGALGVVVGGPVQASLGGNNYWFWNINFEDDPDGWVSDSTLKSAPAPIEEVEEIVAEENVVESPLANTETNVTEEIPQEETGGKMAAQVSDTGMGFGSNPLMSSIIIGAALFLGLIFGSVIIARVLRKN